MLLISGLAEIVILVSVLVLALALPVEGVHQSFVDAFGRAGGFGESVVVIVCYGFLAAVAEEGEEDCGDAEEGQGEAKVVLPGVLGATLSVEI